MSTIIVVSVEGVLCAPDEQPPTAVPVAAGLHLVHALAQAWPIGYISTAPVEIAKSWLREFELPTWAWVASAPMSDRASIILRQLAQRADRARLLVAGDRSGFAEMALVGIATLLMEHNPGFEIGDWKSPSSWSNPDDEE